MKQIELRLVSNIHKINQNNNNKYKHKKKQSKFHSRIYRKKGMLKIYRIYLTLKKKKVYKVILPKVLIKSKIQLQVFCRFFFKLIIMYSSDKEYVILKSLGSGAFG